MALTRDFRATIQTRVARDAAVRDALFTEALNAYLRGELEAGKAMLRDRINATVGFEQLAAQIRKPSKNPRMLTPKGTRKTSSPSCAYRSSRPA